MSEAQDPPDDMAHDPLFEALIAGSIRMDAPEVQARLASDPAFAGRVESTRQALDAVRDAGELERELLAEAESHAFPEAEDRIRQLVLQSTRAPRRFPAWALLAIGAAAAVLAIYLIPRERDGRGLDPNATLGPEYGLESPLGEVSEYTPFAWSQDIRGLLFHVVVYDSEGREIDREENLMGRAWSPEPDRRAAWPDEIRWSLESFDAVGGSPRVSPLASASRAH